MPSAAAKPAVHPNSNSNISWRNKSILVEEGIIETIVLVVREQQAVLSRHSPQNARVWVTRREIADRFVILFSENRTGHVKQFTTTRDDLPQCLQQPSLLPGKSGDVRRPPEPFDVRVPSHHTGPGTRRVQQHAVEGFAVPPGIKLGGVARLQTGTQPQAFKIPAHPLQTHGIRVERGQGDVCEFQNVSCFASGRRTGVEYPHVLPDVQEGRGELRTGVLNGNLSFAKPGQTLYRHRSFKQNSAAIKTACPQTGLLQATQIVLCICAANVRPQSHRWMLVAQIQDAFRVGSVVALELFNPPIGVRKTSLVVSRG